MARHMALARLLRSKTRCVRGSDERGAGALGAD
jgi:hypothetical protein